MAIAHSDHGVDRAGDILVLDLGDLLAGQVVLYGNPVIQGWM